MCIRDSATTNLQSVLISAPDSLKNSLSGFTKDLTTYVDAIKKVAMLEQERRFLNEKINTAKTEIGQQLKENYLGRISLDIYFKNGGAREWWSGHKLKVQNDGSVWDINTYISKNGDHGDSGHTVISKENALSVAMADLQQAYQYDQVITESSPDGSLQSGPTSVRYLAIDNRWFPFGRSPSTTGTIVEGPGSFLTGDFNVESFRSLLKSTSIKANPIAVSYTHLRSAPR